MNRPSNLGRVALAAVLALAACSRAQDAKPGVTLEHATELAQRFLIVDGHIDVPYRLTDKMEDITVRTPGGDFDVPRARAGGLDAPFMSIYTPASYEKSGGAKTFADGLIDMVEGFAKARPDLFRMAASVADVRAAAAAGQIALLMGMENGTPIEKDLNNLDHFARRGIRYITLCHSEDNHICDSSYATTRTWGGLSRFGRDVVLRMNELGVLIDVSHISDQAFDDVIELTRAPPIASHSSARAYTPGFERNLDDARIVRLAQKGGVLMINFGSTFVAQKSREAGDAMRKEMMEAITAKGLKAGTAEAKAFADAWEKAHVPPLATVDDVADHVMHVVKIAGVDHVGFGSDYDGVGPTLPIGLEDVSKYPNLIRVLLERGLSEDDVKKISGENLLRAMAEAEKVAGKS
ncbi:MAG: dipeptidase [Planctomycetes bacterium]|nr:dipeptidase [Planctomycetota bacterium]MCC7169262.1 dipeptidase [Planctomycetota bacterium]